MVAEALALIGIALLVFVLLVTIYVATSRYKLAPSDKIVVYGNVKDKGSAACYHGGKIVWPLIQHYAYLDLKPMTISIDLDTTITTEHQNQRSIYFYHRYFNSTISHEECCRASTWTTCPSDRGHGKRNYLRSTSFDCRILTIEQINQDREAFWKKYQPT